MSRPTAFFLLLLFATALSPAQEQTSTWKGYLVDQMCASHMEGERADFYASLHTRTCNFDDECKASGFGVMIRGTYIKLSDSSSEKALEYLGSITTKSNIYVAVTGIMIGEVIEVETIETAEDPERIED